MGIKLNLFIWAERKVYIPRISRKSLETSFFHIITQGINKEYIFYKDDYINKYLNLMNKYKIEYDIFILAYCIMNNHMHMLIHTKNINNMSKFMHKINGVFSQYYNRKEKRTGVVFRNRFESEPIYDIKYLTNCIKYIHMNPVKAGLVAHPEEYEYSSYNQFDIQSNSILKELFGTNYIQIIDNSDNDYLFKDVDVCKEDYFNDAIKRFEIINNDSIDNILKNRESLKKIIKYLNSNYNIKYIDIMRKFGISQGKMNTLKR